MANPIVKVQTTLGNMTIELDSEAAPVTVKNFLEYVNDSYYEGTIFHRVIKGFMVQGGGLTKEMKAKPSNLPIINEASNGLKNLRGTVAMARTSDPDSATSQFFINHADNDFLDYQGPSADKIGYAVFGKVIDGLDVLDKIASVRTTSSGGWKDTPADAVIIESVSILKK
jgi:cyclophilin family peptidyl-prolyl cis-trans isomerase